MATDLAYFAASAWDLVKTGAIGIGIVLYFDIQWKHYFPSPYDR